MPIVVRPLRAEDVDTVASFNVALARESEDVALDLDVVRRGVRAMLGDAARGEYRLAEDGGRVVGQLMVTREWSDWRCAWWWWIQSVYVAPEARRRGVYRALHESVLADARAREDVHGVRLYVEQDNVRAQRTYEALGMARGRYLVYASSDE